MATKSEDWSVTDVTRKAADYSAKMEGGEVQLQLISFKLSYQGSAPELLVDVPFPCGTTTEELVRWCAEDSVNTQGPTRVPDQEQPIINFGHRSMVQRLMDNGCLKSKSVPFRARSTRSTFSYGKEVAVPRSELVGFAKMLRLN